MANSTFPPIVSLSASLAMLRIHNTYLTKLAKLNVLTLQLAKAMSTRYNGYSNEGDSCQFSSFKKCLISNCMVCDITTFLVP